MTKRPCVNNCGRPVRGVAPRTKFCVECKAVRRQEHARTQQASVMRTRARARRDARRSQLEERTREANAITAMLERLQASRRPSWHLSKGLA